MKVFLNVYLKGTISDAWLFLLFSLYMERGGDGMKEKKHRKRRQKGSMHPFIVFTLLR